MLGVAVSTAVPAVGAICPRIVPGVGAVSTQAWVNPYLAVRALEAMGAGQDAEAALSQALAADEASDVRQVGVVDSTGRSASWSGAACTEWFGHRLGDGFAIQGNMLTGAEVLEAMEDAFRAAEGEELAERLIRALEGGQAAGGDKRGKQSAAVLVRDEEEYPIVDLRVDEHPAPVAELRRVFGVFLGQVRPFLEGMPKRNGAASAAPDEVVEMLLRPPSERPGGAAPDLWTALSGLDLPAERRAELLRLFAPIGSRDREAARARPDRRAPGRGVRPTAARSMIAGLAERIRTGQLSPVALMAETLERIARVDPALSAFICLNPHAREQAEHAERVLRDGRALPPLHGIPIGIKDNYLTADMPTTVGTEAPGTAYPHARLRRRRPAPRRRRDPRRQDPDPRIRLGHRHAADAQPVGHRVHSGRLERRLGRRGRGRAVSPPPWAPTPAAPSASRPAFAAWSG